MASVCHRSWMRGGRLWLWLCISALAIAAAGTGVAQDGPPAQAGDARVKVGMEPSRSSVEGVDSVALKVTVQGFLACAPESAPAPLVVTVLPAHDYEGLRLDLVPDSLQVDWERTQNDGQDRLHYEVDESVEVVARVLSPPRTAVVTEFIVLLQPGETQAGGPGCTAAGYSITQSDEPHEPLTVEPESGSDGLDEDRSFNWLPMFLGVALLSLVAMLAVWRERLHDR